ncbi:acyl-CoA dehydrogenase [Xylophilus rhododendri]|uniref:Acyl-CoA dehydrogenase n=1 Tax=Xylophilus rhododendri TaxID=2697032 RepID=A0A857J8A3_9BURK|nr:acyl-CoA dehydrogenase family protein [Xylophilus rhododendri]QHJ00195.1 acyl-CoA dehydrogenase [Xylophilus rhododendri]
MVRDLPDPPAPPAASAAVLAPLLAEARRLLDQATRTLAHLCSREGGLDVAPLDDYQSPSYELAWTGAELLAAENLLLATRGGSGLDADLAVVHGIETLPAALVRLQGLFADCGLDAEEVDALITSPELAALRRHAGSHASLGAVGHAVALQGGDIAPIALEADAAMAQDAFLRFAREVVVPLAEDIHRQDLTVPESLLQPLREMGVFGLAIPESHGGSAPDGSENALTMIAVTEALSEASLAAAGSLITRPEILARALLAGGTPEQQARWLPRIARGEPLCAIAITEPDHGSDVASLTLRATPCQGGWRLDGAKTWCTFAGKAGLLMVVARTEPERGAGHKGLSLLLVEKPSYEGHDFVFDQPGDGGRLSGRAIPTIGYRGMHSFDLAFENFFVPDAGLVGGAAGRGRGFYFTMAGMVGGRMQTAARACGVMRAALKAAVRHAGDRQVFGAPLASYALTRVKFARMAGRLAASRHLTYAVGRLLEAGQGRMEASLVKLYACRSAEILSRESLQIHGGMGYAEETPASRYFVDARVLSIFEGAEETLALKVIARSMLEAALKDGRHV